MMTIGVAVLAGCDRRAETEAAAALQEAQARVAELERELVQQKIDLKDLCDRRLQAVQAPVSPPPGATPPATPVPEAGAAATAGTADAAGITCADDRCTLPRATFDAWDKDPSGLAKQVRIVPNIKDGATRGFKLFAIRASSPLAALGFENGDLITAIAGRPLKTMDEALAALGTLKGEKQWTIEGERRGAPFKRTIALSE